MLCIFYCFFKFIVFCVVMCYQFWKNCTNCTTIVFVFIWTYSHPGVFCSYDCCMHFYFWWLHGSADTCRTRWSHVWPRCGTWHWSTWTRSRTLDTATCPRLDWPSATGWSLATWTMNRWTHLVWPHRRISGRYLGTSTFTAYRDNSHFAVFIHFHLSPHV